MVAELIERPIFYELVNWLIGAPFIGGIVYLKIKFCFLFITLQFKLSF